MLDTKETGAGELLLAKRDQSQRRATRFLAAVRAAASLQTSEGVAALAFFVAGAPVTVSHGWGTAQAEALCPLRPWIITQLSIDDVAPGLLWHVRERCAERELEARAGICGGAETEEALSIR